MADLDLEARFQSRLLELYKEKMRTHERRLDEWKRQQADRSSLHTELIDTVCI